MDGCTEVKIGIDEVTGTMKIEGGGLEEIGAQSPTTNLQRSQVMPGAKQ